MKKEKLLQNQGLTLEGFLVIKLRWWKHECEEQIACCKRIDVDIFVRVLSSDFVQPDNVVLGILSIWRLLLINLLP